MLPLKVLLEFGLDAWFTRSRSPEKMEFSEKQKNIEKIQKLVKSYQIGKITHYKKENKYLKVFRS